MIIRGIQGSTTTRAAVPGVNGHAATDNTSISLISRPYHQLALSLKSSMQKRNGDRQTQKFRTEATFQELMHDVDRFN
jgi:hypothetical protein